MDPTFTAWKLAFSLQETCMVYVPARYGRFLEGRKTLVHEFVHHLILEPFSGSMVSARA